MLELLKSKHKDVTRWVLAASAESHSSIKSTAQIMDVELLLIKPDKEGSLQGDACGVAIDKYHSENPGHQVFALVATAGTTNLGIIDNLKTMTRTQNKKNCANSVQKQTPPNARKREKKLVEEDLG